MNMIRAVVLLFLFVGKRTFFLYTVLEVSMDRSVTHSVCNRLRPWVLPEPCVVAPNYGGGSHHFWVFTCK